MLWFKIIIWFLFNINFVTPGNNRNYLPYKLVINLLAQNINSNLLWFTLLLFIDSLSFICSLCINIYDSVDNGGE